MIRVVVLVAMFAFIGKEIHVRRASRCIEKSRVIAKPWIVLAFVEKLIDANFQLLSDRWLRDVGERHECEGIARSTAPTTVLGNALLER